MKPFNLEEYLKNPERKIVTKDGRKVRIICTDAKDDDHPLIALVEYPQDNDSEEILSYTKDGHYYSNSRLPKENDLFFVPEKHEGWINIYSDTIVSRIYPSEEEAKENACDGAIATIKIEWEE